MASHIVAFYTATAGLSGALLGSDEEDIVLLQYIIWDVPSRKILTEQQYIVCPGADINENLLSEQCREEYELSEEHVKAGQSLETVLDSFDAIVSKLADEGNKVCLITDGQLHLRQVLHPKCTTKGIELPETYNSFFDVRKEFKSFYHISIDFASTSDMLNYLEITQDPSTNLAVKSCREITTIMERMVADGHRFAIPEVINSRLEPGICTRSEEVDSACVVRARGLPWQSSDQDIAKFFRGLNISKGGVALCLSPQGRRNGEALVRFVSPEHRDMALKRHKHHIGNRYIEVYKASGEDFINVAGGNSNEAQQFLSRGGNVIIRMRGLPYDCTAKQVVDFFEAGDGGCHILDNEDGVLFVRKPDGRATGDAFVLFASEDDSVKALAKHREIIGSRYIELFRSTTAEVQQVLNRSMDPRTYEQQQPLIAQLPQVPILPQQMITSGTRRDCIRLRGLPYEAQVEHVLEFLGDHAKNIVFRGVHMVINAQGQPSGEAFIQMDGEPAAYAAAQQRHHRYMVFGKKQRYIEVFQCSGEDMNLVLSGGLQPQRAVVSPGMLLWDQASAGTSVAQGAPVPGTFLPSALRPPFPGAAALPMFPQTLPQTHNGSTITGLSPLQIKQDPITSPSSLLPQLRHPFIHPTIDLPQVSQIQSAAFQTVKPGIPVSSSSAAMIPSVFSQYPEFAVSGQPASSLTNQSMMLLPGSKLPGAIYQTFPPGMQLLAVSSSADIKNHNLLPKYSASPFIPMQYAPSHAIALPRPQTPDLQAISKRSYDQAFTGDKNFPYRSIKRPPPRVATNPQISHGQIGISGLSSPHLAMQAPPSHHLGAIAAPPPPMISTLYASPQLYPSL